MAKELLCHTCKAKQNLADLSFDEADNLVCDQCGTVIFPVTVEADRELGARFPREIISPGVTTYPAKKEPLPIRLGD